MPDTPSTHEKKVRTFWARYAEKELESGAKPPFDRWLVIRAEAYVAAHPGRKLADQSAAKVDAYLAAFGRKPEIKGRQVRQAADAIRIRLELAGVAWINAVDCLPHPVYLSTVAGNREIGKALASLIYTDSNSAQHHDTTNTLPPISFIFNCSAPCDYLLKFPVFLRRPAP